MAPNEVAAIDTRSDRVVAAIPVGDRPGAIAFGSGSLWVANLDDQTISRIDPGGPRKLGLVRVPGPPTGIAAGPGGLWVVESPGTSSVLVGRVDPVFNKFGTVTRIGNVDPTGAVAIATQGNSVWVAPSTGLLTRLDGTTVAGQLDPNASPAGIAIGEGATWLTDTDANNVVRVDSSGLPTPIGVGDAPTGIAVGADGVWVVDSLDDAVVRIDPDKQSVSATIQVGQSPAGVAFGAGSVWVANSGDGTVTRINPITDKSVTIAVGGSPQAITIADGKAWVTVDEQSIAPSRGAPDGGTLRIVSSSDVPFMDPALGDDYQLGYATCAQLLNYPDKAGLAGSLLTPEVAQSLPARSPDGKTYTFKIRPGFRFSPPSNEPVTAQTFKATIERTLNPGTHSYYAHFLDDIVGAGAYMSGKASHIAGVIAKGDTLTVRLLAPAPDFLARISQPSASCAVPSDTPVSRKGENMIPSAGPYYVTSYTPHQGIVLMRNPNYHGRRPHHFARIELSVGISPKRAISEIEAGLADYTGVGSLWSASAARAAHASRLAARYGPGSAAAARGAQQYFASPAAQLDYFVLNTHRPLFSDVRMRQAVNYAINRRALAQRGDRFHPLPADPTDHYLPPGMPGFRDAHVYPMTPDVAQGPEAGTRWPENSRALHLRLLSVSGAGPNRGDRPGRDRSPSPDQEDPIRDVFHNAGQARPPVRPRLGRLVTRLHRPRGDAERASRRQLRRPDLRRSGLPAKTGRGVAALWSRALPHLRTTRPRADPRRRASGRVRQPDRHRLLLRADRLPDLRDLRHGPRGTLHQASA